MNDYLLRHHGDDKIAELSREADLRALARSRARRRRTRARRAIPIIRALSTAVTARPVCC
ncbi:MAG TPA: hypothetical protein VI076_06555 [Actinopolymorphaceae bacterium]